MRNIFLFIRRYFTFFTFLALQGLSLWFLFTYNHFHRARFLGLANEMTGRINAQYNKVEDYFYLKEENRRLHRYNDSLLNLLPQNFVRHDSSARLVKDSLAYDTAGYVRRYLLRTATVVYNTVNAQKNYIQINRGANQGIRENMAVISAEGNAVGVVLNVSPNFSQVMSLLHVDSRLNVSLKGPANFGTIEWDGKDPGILLLKGLAKTVMVNKGDTIITSGNNTLTFPKGFMVGTVSEVKLDNTTGLYLLKIKTAVHFNSLQQVHVIENLEREEQSKLLEETRKKTEDAKKNTR